MLPLCGAGLGAPPGADMAIAIIQKPPSEGCAQKYVAIGASVDDFLLQRRCREVVRMDLILGLR